eukprot:gnl/TRDRNA2_/TRDRNA2_84724_c0_seq1.p1 gnl/TRDRNA2_/TRDRNA2_84724_c0~~gnl/TRDRNA2_/TRDRNA2_84724_c0_seq1.p1  ORF type:complete len:423 (+),score=101.36 gnl/TRDRNA2_/TRDRNA2_84724_c0_seq1:88-1269(+)
MAAQVSRRGVRLARCRNFSESSLEQRAAVGSYAPPPPPELWAGPTGDTRKADKAKKEREDEKKKPMGWTKFFGYLGSGVGGLTFCWFFYKANYSLHKTEILITEAFMQLPLYPPPGPSLAEKNSTVNGGELQADLVTAVAEWFSSVDLQSPEGVTRDDVLELFREMGLCDDQDKLVKDFLAKGEGRLEERRRFSVCSIQEVVTLLDKLSDPARLAKIAEQKKEQAEQSEQSESENATPAALPTDNAEQRPALVGDAAVQHVRRKLQGMSSFLPGASAMMQMSQVAPALTEVAAAASEEASIQGRRSAATGAASSPGTMSFLPSTPPSSLKSTASDPASEVGLDDEQQRQFEVSRLSRIERQLLDRLERVGSLSPAEEARLADVRQQKLRAAAL